MPVSLFCGLDEAGRGPLAGPVTAGAVILPPDFPIEMLNDSKKLSEKRRDLAEAVIKEKACWGIGAASHEEIDALNILRASLLAMQRAFDAMLKMLAQWTAAHGIAEFEVTALADGTFAPDILCAMARCEPKADAHYPEVMAASILAKTARDKIMIEMDKKYPEYGYAKHKGYPTAAHIQICRRLGGSPIQRRSFRY